MQWLAYRLNFGYVIKQTTCQRGCRTLIMYVWNNTSLCMYEITLYDWNIKKRYS